ncbi:hypothetical protein SESBI_17953 [Sesbania bispinosa]|nr:hypothetical protein SESBI_17953 [Sesbania bispinosa]
MNDTGRDIIFMVEKSNVLASSFSRSGLKSAPVDSFTFGSFRSQSRRGGLLRGSMAMEKAEDELHNEIDKLPHQQLEITDRSFRRDLHKGAAVVAEETSRNATAVAQTTLKSIDEVHNKLRS